MTPLSGTQRQQHQHHPTKEAEARKEQAKLRYTYYYAHESGFAGLGVGVARDSAMVRSAALMAGPAPFYGLAYSSRSNGGTSTAGRRL